MMMDAGSYRYPNANLWRMESLFFLIFRVEIHHTALYHRSISLVLQFLSFMCMCMSIVGGYLYVQSTCVYVLTCSVTTQNLYLSVKQGGKRVFKTQLFLMYATYHSCYLYLYSFFLIFFLILKIACFLIQYILSAVSPPSTPPFSSSPLPSRTAPFLSLTRKGTASRW